MLNRQSARPDWFWLAPFGRIGRALGFRWIFPIGTMPFPYHRLFPVVVLGFPAVWLATTIADRVTGDAGGRQWPWMLLAGALLGIPLSIPIVSWGFRAFGGMLAQALLFLAGMIALVIDVAAGREAPAWGLLPAAYIATFAVQRVGGLWRMRSYHRLLAEFEPIAAGDRLPVFPANKPFEALGAIRQGLTSRAYVAAREVGTGQIVERIDADEAAALKELGKQGLPRGWRLESAGEGHALMRPHPMPPGPTLAIEMTRIGRRVGNGPGVMLWRIDDGSVVHETVSGVARIVGALPLAVLFYAISLTGRSEWFVGFVPRDTRLTTKELEDPAHVLAPQGECAPRTDAQRADLLTEAFAAFGEDRAAERARAVERHNRIRRMEAEGKPTRVVYRGREIPSRIGRADIPQFWREVAADPARWKAHRESYLVLAAQAPDSDREVLRRTLDWLEAAIKVRARDAIEAAAALLGAMPAPLLASDLARLETMFNSRVLGMVWKLTPDFDKSPLPPKVPVAGDEAGYGLIRSAPELYLKLAQLGPAMAELVGSLVAEAMRYGVPMPPALSAMAQPPAATG